MTLAALAPSFPTHAPELTSVVSLDLLSPAVSSMQRQWHIGLEDDDFGAKTVLSDKYLAKPLLKALIVPFLTSLKRPDCKVKNIMSVTVDGVSIPLDGTTTKSADGVMAPARSFIPMGSTEPVVVVIGISTALPWHISLENEEPVLMRLDAKWLNKPLLKATIAPFLSSLKRKNCSVSNVIRVSVDGVAIPLEGTTTKSKDGVMAPAKSFIPRGSSGPVVIVVGVSSGSSAGASLLASYDSSWADVIDDEEISISQMSVSSSDSAPAGGGESDAPPDSLFTSIDLSDAPPRDEEAPQLRALASDPSSGDCVHSPSRYSSRLSRARTSNAMQGRSLARLGEPGSPVSVTGVQREEVQLDAKRFGGDASAPSASGAMAEPSAHEPTVGNLIDVI